MSRYLRYRACLFTAIFLASLNACVGSSPSKDGSAGKDGGSAGRSDAADGSQPEAATDDAGAGTAGVTGDGPSGTAGVDGGAAGTSGGGGTSVTVGVGGSGAAGRDGSVGDSAGTAGLSGTDSGVSACGEAGQPCCANTCSAGLTCLAGATCSCVKALFGRYVVRTDGTLLYEISDATLTQTPVLDANTGMPLRDVKEVQEGYRHSCAVLGAAKTAWCWRTAAAGNAFGQLGNGTKDASGPIFRATQVLLAAGQALTNATSIATSPSTGINNSSDTRCAVTDDGRLYCWGDLSYLSNGGITTSSPYATPITSNGSTPLSGVIAVATDSSYACALVQGASSREVWCWGRNQFEQLGLGDAVTHQYPTRVVGLSDPTQIALADATTCVRDGSTVRCWGANASGQAGLGHYNTPVHGPTQVVLMGGVTPLADIVDLRGGDNGYGQIANFCALKKDNSLLCWGTAFQNYPSTYIVTNVVAAGSADSSGRTPAVRVLSSDGVYHIGAATRMPNCGLVQ